MTTVMMDRNYEPHYRDSQQVPITSGVISNSDEHHYRQQQDMKHQMQREYQDYVANPPPDRPTVDNPRFSEPQMSPRKPVYYRVTTPDMGLPLGRYEQQRKALDDERQRDYNKLLQKINAKESQIREERRRNWSYPHETAELYDYDKEKQRLREERRQEYEEFRKHKAEMERYKPPPTPPGMGLPVGQYEQYRKMLKDQLVAEYKNSLKQQQDEQLYMRLDQVQKELSEIPVTSVDDDPRPEPKVYDPQEVKHRLRQERQQEYNTLLHQPNRKHDPKPPTPPGGLSIPSEEDRQRNMRENKRMYAEDLLRQKDEQLLNRAQHEMGIPVIDRSNQASPAHQPPPSPNRRDPRGYRGPPDGYVPSAYDPNAVPRSPGNWQGDRHGDRNFGNDKNAGEKVPSSREGKGDRPKQFTGSSRTSTQQSRRTNRQTPRFWDGGKRVDSPPSTGSTSLASEVVIATAHQTDAGTYDLNLESYKPNPYEREKRQELNRDYNNFIQNKQREEAGRRREKFEEQQRHPPAQVKLGNYYNHEQHDKYQQKLQEERRHDYQQQLAKFVREESSSLRGSSGLIGDVNREHERTRKMMQLRNQDYNEMLQKVYPRPPLETEVTSKRSSWSQQSRKGSGSVLTGLPLTQDRYDEKRKQLERIRNQEYNDLLKKLHLKDNYQPPVKMEKPLPNTEVSGYGLPLSQRYYDERRAQIEKQRNREYNEYLAKKGTLSSRTYEPKQLSRQASHDAIENSSARQAQSNYHPARKYSGQNGLLGPRAVTDFVPDRVNGAYPDGQVDIGPQRAPPGSPVKMDPEIYEGLQMSPKPQKSTPDNSINFDEQVVIPIGKGYDSQRNKYQQEWRQSFVDHLKKLKEEQSRKEMLYASKATEREQHEREARESPPIIPKGDSVDKRRNSLLKDLRSDYQHYLEKQPKVNRDKDFWQKTREPHIYPIDGEYEQRRGKIRQELRADFMKFMEKQTPPKERKKDFGEQGGVLFDPQYSKQKEVMTSRRRQEFQDYLQVPSSPSSSSSSAVVKKRSEVPRRNVDPAFDNHTMFSEMGGYAQQRDKINQQRSAEYNQYIKEGGWYDSPDGARNREPQYRNDDNQRNREY